MVERRMLINLMRMKAVYASIIAVCLLSAKAEQLPRDLFNGLAAEDFKTRLDNQEKLLEWARNSPDTGRLDELYDGYLKSEDPEIRTRCLNVLRKLVEDQYLKDGKGYVGIVMGVAMVPKEDGEGLVENLRIDSIVPEGPADQAGMKVGDLILRVNGKILATPNVMDSFKELVQAKNPGEKVIIELKRAGQELKLAVTLGKLPAGADLRFFGEPQLPLEELDKNAKEAYFKDWLEKKKKERVP